MRFKAKLACITALSVTLGSCGTINTIVGGNDDNSAATIKAPVASVSDTPKKVGEPYQIDGKNYTPQDVASYDEVGYASWYGEDLIGKDTANGEPFIAGAISGAHKTLPLPTYVEVTALDTGKTILVRINDRGPMVNDRLIDLSYGAAKQLGIVDKGVTGVRVRKVNPNEQERIVLRSGGIAQERIATPDSLLYILRKHLRKLPEPKAVVRPVLPKVAPETISAQTSPRTIKDTDIKTATITKPVNDSGVGATYVAPSPPVTPKPAAKPVSASGRYFVQVAALSNKARATALAKELSGRSVATSSGKLWRIQMGPYASKADARAGLAKARQRGYKDARVLRD